MITEIKKNLYEIKFKTEESPIYILIDNHQIRITQPCEEEPFEEEEYFGKGQPQEMVMTKSNFKEMLDYLNKIMIIENLK